MNLLIVTGMSGAGKTQAANALEDMGYYCVDNIPPLIIPSFVDLFSGRSNEYNKLAIITDIRGGALFGQIMEVLESLRQAAADFKILFLTASEEIIIRRYKENRRSHPLCQTESITLLEAVKKERKILDQIRKSADYVIDTSAFSRAQLKQRMKDLFLGGDSQGFKIQCVSFGYKYGTPADADLVLDVRCLINPFYDEQLRDKTGLEAEIQEYVMGPKESREYLQHIQQILSFIMPLYIKEGKSQLVIAFGCTGGKHRSVTFAELINSFLAELGYFSITVHRDINK